MLFVVFIAVFLATVFFPGPLIELLIINTAIGILVSCLQIVVSLLPSYSPKRKVVNGDDYVSIIVPAYNEPPALLMQTIDALSRSKYVNMEVLVIDNNTKDPEVWKPVERFCASLGPRFRFFHVDPLDGFKAGALNYALEKVNPESRYVAVVDADYVVLPDFIQTALSYFTNRDIALVQFPQEYRNTTKKNQPIADEYHHFFKIYMNMANHLDCVPSTGTVSVYSIAGLKAIKGFRSHTMTEDADAGLRLYRAGYYGIYVERGVGYGLMPYDIEAYRKQKRRWALGNAQSLGALFSLCGAIPMRTWFGFLAHLTAWDHLNFLPFAVLAGYALVVTPLIPTTDPHRLLLDIASVSIFVTILAKFGLFVVTFRNEKNALSRAVKALAVHMGMSFLYSEALIELLFLKQSVFERTNKFIKKKVRNPLKSIYKEVILGVWFAFGAIETIWFGGRFITFIAFALSSIALLCVLYVYWVIRPTRSISKKISQKAESAYAAYLPVSTADVI